MDNDFQSLVGLVNSSRGRGSVRLKSSLDLINSQRVELSNRDSAYTEFLKEYISDYRWKRWSKFAMKVILFLCILVAGFVLATVSFNMISKLIVSNASQGTTITMIISSMAGIITAFIAIPLAITNYLFNPGEDEKIATIISQMQNHDLESNKLIQKMYENKEK